MRPAIEVKNLSVSYEKKPGTISNRPYYPSKFKNSQIGRAHV